ncbi:hypothetical protein E0M25_24550 [Bacillus mycoides]|uniref:hypothetical protein n=1 Tax=Bacillus mycoides TaxID=1405 RepID=UPI001038C2C9|nr:hypothetical protein [Bacillus mycoides]TBX72059.1 hypothetical protein E0M25_24550 [Bacillus mycoides]
MIKLNYTEIAGSISGQIEYMVFYDRIGSLVMFYNYSQDNYEDYIFTEYEMTMTIKDELYGIEKDFLEFQKIKFIVLCYSEIEKIIEFEIEYGKKTTIFND